MNIPDSAISVRTELIGGRPMYFATAKIAGQIYVGNGDSEREAKYDLSRNVENDRNRHKIDR